MKTAIYVRCSDEAGESATLETQKDSCIKYCESRRWDDYEIYEDDGYSAASIIRPDFQRLLQDAKQGVIDTIVVWRLDRFSRSLLDSVNVIEDLKEWNCNLTSVMEAFIDLQDNHVGQTFFNIIMTFAQYERESIAERLLTNRRKYIQQGQMTCGQAPFGYDYVTPTRARSEDKKPGWHINEKEASIVRKIFELYTTEHLSAPKICHRLLREGGPKTPDTVRSILNREFYYTGKLPLKYTVFNRKRNGEKFEREKITGIASLEPLIDRKTWNSTQRIRKAHLSRWGKGKKHQFLFRGKIQCLACNRPLFSINQSSGYSYYAHYCKNGRQLTVPSKMVDDQIWKALIEKLKDPQDLKRTIEALQEKRPESNIRTLRGQENSVQGEITRLEKDIQRKGAIALDEPDKVVREVYRKEIMKLSTRLKSLENSLVQIKEKREELEKFEITIKDADRVAREIQARIGELDNLTFEQKRAIVDKIYQPGSIFFFPKWYFESDTARSENPLLFSNDWWQRNKPSTIQMKKGHLICMGIIDIDFHWKPKRFLAKP